MAKIGLGGLQMVTANDLRTGAVVFMRHDGQWTDDARLAEAVLDSEAAERLLSRAKTARNAMRVVDPVLIDVAAEGEIVSPVRLRERIRASGPTVTFGPAIRN